MANLDRLTQAAYRALQSAQDEALRLNSGTVEPEHLLLETDAPYLPPHPYRGQRNEPAYLALVAHRLAELRGLPTETLASQVTENTRRVFRLKPDTGNT